MFRFSVTLLTLFVMLLHASLGCCRHHAHGRAEGAECAVPNEQTKVVRETRACPCAHAAAERGRRQAADHEGNPSLASCDRDAGRGSCPQRHDDCDEGTCKYLGSTAGKVPTPADSGVYLNRLPTLDDLSHKLVSGVHGDCRPGDSLPAYGSGPCVRDLTQTWLL